MTEEAVRGRLDRIQAAALAVGIAGTVGCAVAAWTRGWAFLSSYLFAYLLGLGLSLGSMALLMFHRLVGGAWGVAIRRLLESAMRTLPLMVILFLPIALGVRDFYPWAGSASLGPKAYLNLPFFLARAAGYFALWGMIAWLLTRWFDREEKTGEAAYHQRLQLLSGGALVAYGVTVTFASIDWVMSLEADWVSTVYGLIFIVGQALSSIAFAIAALALLGRAKPFADSLVEQDSNDLGNLLLTFVMLWAYLAFAQYLIVWSGDLPRENRWYLRRLSDGWSWIAVALLLFQFAAPFFILLFRRAKRNLRVLGAIAGAVLAFRILDLFWIATPAGRPHGPALDWTDLAALAAVGGLWLWFYVCDLKRRPLLPLRDPLSRAPAVREGVVHG
jgi:hypothetical protein